MRTSIPAPFLRSKSGELKPRRFRNVVFAIPFFALLGCSTIFGQTLTASQTVGLSLSPTGIVYSLPTSLPLVSAGSFLSYVGAMIVGTEIRTTATGAASLVLQVSSDFTPATGPSAASGNLQYQCSLASYGAACSGQIQASTASQTAVVSYPSLSCTGGGGSCSSSDPNIVTVQFSVADQTAYKTGTYTANVTFTISAT